MVTASRWGWGSLGRVGFTYATL
ncbi:MAG: hypothetical protein JWN04_2347, partial [Myxococcaceae bacterium]|nr:hypothetical protein [Myxococcaceae bacterium]